MIEVPNIWPAFLPYLGDFSRIRDAFRSCIVSLIPRALNHKAGHLARTTRSKKKRKKAGVFIDKKAEKIYNEVTAKMNDLTQKCNDESIGSVVLSTAQKKPDIHRGCSLSKRETVWDRLLAWLEDRAVLFDAKILVSSF